MRTIKEAIQKIESTLEEKGNLYGNTYRRVGLALNVPSQYSIIVRMMEKLMRLDRMVSGFSQTVEAQAVADEFLDLACYAILGLFESSPVQDESKSKIKGGGTYQREY